MPNPPSPLIRVKPSGCPRNLEKLWDAWEFIQRELLSAWEAAISTGGGTLDTDAVIRCYNKTYAIFYGANWEPLTFFYGRRRGEDVEVGEIFLWIDGLLQYVDSELNSNGGVEFNEITFKKLGLITTIGHLARRVFSSLDRGTWTRADQRICVRVIENRLFCDNRARIIKMCLQGIVTARSVDTVPTNMQALSGMFHLLLVPAGNKGQSTLSAPEITAEYIRAMELFYNTERANRLTNLEDDQYTQWADDMFARELLWAGKCLSIGSDPEIFVNMVNTSIDKLKRIGRPPSPLPQPSYAALSFMLR